ncbi:MAG: PEP-CTERM sorting domain-containing protein [Planctomycetota bacterium]|nr:PEP-CTERM sorting domain-containing protein [Planctomycetota bacterium]
MKTSIVMYVMVVLFSNSIFAESWTTLGYPWLRGTVARGISGNSIVGDCDYGSFLYIIPEPVTLLLLGLGVVILRRKY